VVENSTFAVVISILAAVFQEIKIFPVWAATLPFPVLVTVAVARGQFLRTRRSRKLDLPLEFRCYVIFTEIDNTISGFGGHIAISGCRSLSQPSVDTVFELAMFDTPIFAVEISMMSVIVPEILAFPVWRPLCYFRLSVSVAFIWDTFFELAEVENFAFCHYHIPVLA